MMRLVDQSDTGLGLEGLEAECGAIAAGDLVAVRFSASDPLVLGKVVRSVASKLPGHVLLGVRRLSAALQLLELEREAGERPAETLRLMFVPGLDSAADTTRAWYRSASSPTAPALHLRGEPHLPREAQSRPRARPRMGARGVRSGLGPRGRPDRDRLIDMNAFAGGWVRDSTAADPP
jgi:cation diffusion facilitator CzcD-associated flavoprotein CzcO